MDILLDQTTGDAVFYNGAASGAVVSDFNDVVVQRIYIRLASFQGEWWVDTTYGVPYLQQIYTKVKNKTNVDIIIQEQILSVEGVQTILSFTSTIDNAARRYSCSFNVLTTQNTATGVITL